MTEPPDPRIVVVGDALLDRDVEGHVERLSPDAPVPVLDEQSRRARPGGAALAASLAALDGDPVTLVASVAADPAGEELSSLLEALGVQLIAVASAGPTPEKIRLLADGRPMLRLDRGGPPARPGTLPDNAREALEHGAVVVMSDYGRGMAADRQLRAVLRRRRRPTLWDPHPCGSEPVPGATLVTPNLAELRAAVAVRQPSDNGRTGGGGAAQTMRAIAEATAAGRRAWKAHAVVTTLGRDGALLVDGDGPPLAVPAVPATGGDPCGAGDRFVAAIAAGLLHGALVSEAVIEAVAAASRFVAAGGARAVPAGAASFERRAAIPLTPTHDAAAVVRRVRAGGGTVVVAGGCFDLLHAGHVCLLESARRLGDCLIVAMNSDASVRRLKGDGRPVVPEADRAALLAALSCVDAVAVFDEDAPTELLTRLQPDIFAKGGDYSSRTLPEASTLARWGGQAVVLPYLSGRSTTGLLQLAGDLP